MTTEPVQDPAVVRARLREIAASVTSDEDARVAIAQLRAFGQAQRARTWEPYTWQHPHRHPEGWVSETAPGRNVCDTRCADLPYAVPTTHGFWLQRGGRGTGKTEGAAHYVDRHVTGPPCDPRVPGGHRVTIAAPTQTDAVSSCYEGVSGLKSVNPLLTISTGRQGTIVRWPSGAVARLLGAHSSLDVDRARAWSNVCVAEGTLIRTQGGPVPIEDVRPGHYVWTRTGLRRVVAAGCTGVREVLRVTADGADAWVTPDHPIALPDGGFCDASQVSTEGATVLVWTEQQSPTTGRSGPNELTGTSSTAGGCSTGTSTPVRSAPSHLASMCITGITTSSTTPRETSSPSPRPSTPTSTTETAGTTGTLRAAGHLWQRVRHGRRSAGSAEPSSPTATLSRRSTAQDDAGTVVHVHGRNGCAACAVTGSPAPSGTRPAPAPRPAEVSPPTRRARVYDLAVDGHHEFYAGNLLVGNCLWWVEEAAAMPRLGGLNDDNNLGVLDQAPYTLRLHAPDSTAPQPHMVVTTTPKNRPEVIRLLSRPDRIETWGRTRDAYRLDPAIRKALEEAFAGSTAGAQELDGELIKDVPGALWVALRPDTVDGVPNPDQRPGIGNDRLTLADVTWRSHDPDAPAPLPGVPVCERVVIAVDPPGGRTECGIVVVGTIGRHGYVLADLSLAGPPDTWARIVLQAYIDYGAEGIAAEHTYGGDMVTDVISTRAEQMTDAGLLPGPPPIFKVPTKVGKRLRAEPVQGIYQQHRVHHVGFLEGVEAEQRTWIPNETKDSPNRIDALVHGLTYLLIRARPGKVANPARSTRRFNTTQGGR